MPVYSSFLQRGFDQLVHDIAIPNLHVIVCVDRAGIVGNDGETHHGLFDLAFFRLIPNFTIMAPKDFNELEKMLEFAVNINGPVAIRYPRGSEEKEFKKCEEIVLGNHEVLKVGKNATILAIGKMVARAQKIADNLLCENIDATVINMRFLKPINEEQILDEIKNKKIVITIEDGTEINGLGNVIEEIIVKNKLKCKFVKYAYPDEFIKHGSIKEIENKYNISEEAIARDILEKFIEI